MRLIHFTDGPFKEKSELNSRSMRTHEFMPTESAESISELKQKIQKLSRAKLLFEAPIVQNI